MSKKQLSSARMEHEYYEDSMRKTSEKFHQNMAIFFLRLPLPLSYEIWRKLHLIKGDWIE